MDARYLAIWIATKTDEERDRLRQDLDLHHKLRDALLQVRYPIAVVPLVGFAFESQETGDRDFGGNWYTPPSDPAVVIRPQGQISETASK